MTKIAITTGNEFRPLIGFHVSDSHSVLPANFCFTSSADAQKYIEGAGLDRRSIVRVFSGQMDYPLFGTYEDAIEYERQSPSPPVVALPAFGTGM